MSHSTTSSCTGSKVPLPCDFRTDGPLSPSLPRSSVTPVEHYTNAFTCSTMGCFRMIQDEDGTGHAQHCPYRTIWRGRFKDAAGKWHTVISCDGHRADLDSVQRIGGAFPVRSELPWRA
jgi:hypothetical protein